MAFQNVHIRAYTALLFFTLVLNSVLAIDLRLPPQTREQFLNLQKESRHCELGQLINENLQLFLNSNDDRDVLFELASYTLHCGDTSQAILQIEQAFIYGLDMDHPELITFIPSGENESFDKLVNIYTMISKRNQINSLWAMYFGILLIIMVYNLILFISLRDSSFFLLSLFVFLSLHAFGHYHVELGVFVKQVFPWFDYLQFNERPFVFFLNLSLTVYIIFIRRFIQLPNDKWWIRINNISLCVSIIFCVIAFFDIRLAYFKSPLDALIVVLLGLLAGIIVWVKRIPHAKLFFTANIILTLGYVAAILVFKLGWSQFLFMGVFGPEKVGFVLFMLILSLTVSFNINRLKTEKLAIEQESVRTLETRVKERTQELNHEKIKVEEKNTEILSSIEYARRIQTAILPPMKIVRSYLHDSFILYMPKDIVAGDFYWMETIGETVFFAACDCTGHGVPGALVSVVCNNALNRALNEFSEREPGKILDKTRELVVENFAKSDDDVKDGMDISLCALKTSNMELLWAGANNPLWIYRFAQNTIEEIRPDKQPVGKGHELKPFQTQQISISKNDVLYLFTDGYADQFGGDKGKKMTRAKFKEFLLSIARESMEQQKILLAENHYIYKGSEEQVDDICVIGVRPC
jgi:serine phosphatase RsbU (regulator of sigma subunit)